MSRRFDRQMKINQAVADIMQDPQTMYFLAGKLIRRKPKYLPLFAWKALLSIVLAPTAKKPMINPNAQTSL